MSLHFTFRFINAKKRVLEYLEPVILDWDSRLKADNVTTGLKPMT
jgi:hypothetical protein